MDMSVGPLRWLSAEELMLLNYGTGDKGDAGLIPGLGRSSGEGKDYTLQYSGLNNSMNCIVHGVSKKSVMTEQLSLGPS